MAKRGTKEAADGGAPVKARVLIRANIGGEWYEPNTIVTGPADLIQAHEAQGSLDSDEDAVAYAESLAPAAE